MKKTLLLSTLAVLAIMSFATFSVASTGNYTWSWTQCNTLTIKGALEIQANVGATQAIISWGIPWQSYENNFGCYPYRATGVEISGVIIHSGANGIWSAYSIPETSGSIGLAFTVEHCYFTGHITQCSQPQPYAAQYGDYVTVSITAIYNGGFTHETTQTLKITS